MMPNRLFKRGRRGLGRALMLWKVRVKPLLRRRRLTPAEYWGIHTVAASKFKTADESLAHLQWRNDQYIDYIDLMPVAGHDDQAVLDYGCGPGHDLVGLGHFSRPSRLIGCDVSPKALSLARGRLGVHGIEADLVQTDETEATLPFEDGSIDYLHSSGVVHHVPDPAGVMREFRRILKPDGSCRVMVYNYDSVFLHLNVAYLKQVVEKQDSDLGVRDAFAKATDGRYCPISEVWRPAEFIELASTAGFSCRLLGCAVSRYEVELLTMRSDAIKESRLPAESRDFLSRLTFDSRGLPTINGQVAGVDAVYELSLEGSTAS